MKKILSIACVLSFSFLLFGFTPNNIDKNTSTNVVVKSEFDKGFEDGWCEGWKDVKGQNSFCPFAPFPPFPTLSQSSDSYRDGYNTGFKAGMRKARNN
tara:strand:- start:75 stop:368 length:294 start_codon:yes stop_codon:yes gene_type:complete